MKIIISIISLIWRLNLWWWHDRVRLGWWRWWRRLCLITTLLINAHILHLLLQSGLLRWYCWWSSCLINWSGYIVWKRRYRKRFMTFVNGEEAGQKGNTLVKCVSFLWGALKLSKQSSLFFVISSTHTLKQLVKPRIELLTLKSKLSSCISGITAMLALFWHHLVDILFS